MARQSRSELAHNTALIADPAQFAREHHAATATSRTHGFASWSYLCGEEFAAIDGGMSYADVEAAVDASANVVSDPPRTLDMDLARRQIAALEDLPRPTLVTWRTGARSSALIYLDEGLRSGESAEQVLARGESDGAPFARSAEFREWIEQGVRGSSQGRRADGDRDDR